MLLRIIIHESFESPGAIKQWAKTRHHEARYTVLSNGDPLPADTNFDLLIVMGGPQSCATTTDECPHFDAKKEMELIRKAVRENKKVLGVCLGAQLMGEAFGAKFAQSPNKEIGAYPLTLTEAGKKDPLLDGFYDGLVVGQWHGDMPGLTEDAVVLATSEGCPRQIIRFAPNAYAFQCHLELTRKSIESYIEHGAEELETLRGKKFIATGEEMRAFDYGEMNDKLFEFLDRFASEL